MINADFAGSIWRKMFIISWRLRTTAYGILDKDFNCSLAQFPIMQFFFTYPNVTPAVKDLTSYIGLPSGAISQAVDGLVEASVLERIPSEKDKRSSLIRATDELLTVRNKAIDHFAKMLESFKSLGSITPEEIASADEIFVRLAESRTGGELSVVRNPADLSVPGLLKHRFIDPEQLRKLPPFILTMHFVTVLKGPTLIYYYETRGRVTLGKLRLLDHARRKTTQKVNLFEKVQIPGYEEAIRKIKRFMEDEENLSKSSQKILKAIKEKREEEEKLNKGKEVAL